MLVPFWGTPTWRPEIGKKTSGVHFCLEGGLFSLVIFRKIRNIFLLILALFNPLNFLFICTFLSSPCSGWFCNIIATGTVNNNASFLRTAKDLCIYFCVCINSWPPVELQGQIYSTFLALKIGKNALFCQAVAKEFKLGTFYCPPHLWCDISLYNPPINFRAILLATLRHVVQNYRTVITQ